MKSKWNFSRASVFIYFIIFFVLIGLFFTNDFGLVDIHKTAIITAVGIDMEDGEVIVTGELVVPQPSQSGENIKYTQVQGSGLTIADALNEINAKTGFYPKLQFCDLILVGESCKERELFSLLACFYRKNFSELTALVAACKGKAADMLALKSDVEDSTSEAIIKVLSDEIKKSANANPMNLKEIAMTNYSKSAACYMPYVEANKQGTSENGGNGENVGGSDGNQSGSDGSSGSSGSGSAGGGGESGGSQSSGGASGGGGGSSGEAVEFTARKTAIYSEGIFKGVLDERQSFALSAIKNDIHLAVLPCDADGIHYTMGMKNIDCGIKLNVENGTPKATLSFKAKAQIQGARVVLDPETAMHDDVVSPEVLRATEAELQRRMEDLIKTCAETNCDVLGIKDLLHKYNYKYFEAFKDDILTRMKVNFKIQIGSVS